MNNLVVLFAFLVIGYIVYRLFFDPAVKNCNKDHDLMAGIAGGSIIMLVSSLSHIVSRLFESTYISILFGEYLSDILDSFLALIFLGISLHTSLGIKKNKGTKKANTQKHMKK